MQSTILGANRFFARSLLRPSAYDCTAAKSHIATNLSIATKNSTQHKRLSLFATTAATTFAFVARIDGKVVAACQEDNHNDGTSTDMSHPVIRPDDEFFYVPEDYVPKTYSMNKSKMDRALGPCDISWKRFDMCIERYLQDDPISNFQVAEKRCMKYGIPLMECFNKNQESIMKRYAEN